LENKRTGFPFHFIPFQLSFHTLGKAVCLVATCIISGQSVKTGVHYIASPRITRLAFCSKDTLYNRVFQMKPPPRKKCKIKQSFSCLCLFQLSILSFATKLGPVFVLISLFRAYENRCVHRCVCVPNTFLQAFFIIFFFSA
jgi:hypothetical protein